MAAYPVSLTVALDTEEKHEALLEFCRDHRIAVETTEQYVPVFVEKTRKKPTTAFKHFCGPENLAKDGLASEEDIYNIIMRYAKTFKLIFPDGTIQLNRAMKDGFQTDMARVRSYEILGLIVRAF
jgi:pyruvate formate-lyase activating enzyme-like uncharacterized protein